MPKNLNPGAIFLVELFDGAPRVFYLDESSSLTRINRIKDNDQWRPWRDLHESGCNFSGHTEQKCLKGAIRRGGVPYGSYSNTKRNEGSDKQNHTESIPKTLIFWWFFMIFGSFLVICRIIDQILMEMGMFFVWLVSSIMTHCAILLATSVYISKFKVQWRRRRNALRFSFVFAIFLQKILPEKLWASKKYYGPPLILVKPDEN